MKILDLQQSSPEWHQHRANSFNASDAPALQSVSPYKTRSDLIREKATGIVPDVDVATQARFDAGHTAEAAARPIAEGIIEEELYAVTCVDDVDGMRLSASLDGFAMESNEIWEHKNINQDNAPIVSAGDVPAQYKPQLIHQCIVTGAKRALFMVSDGTPARCFYTWFTPTEIEKRDLITAWKQFAEDVANYKHEPVAEKVTGAVIEGLPALFVQVEGRVVASNMDSFRVAAKAFMERLPARLETDQDFADTEKAIKVCKETESKIAATKQMAMAQAADIDALFSALDQVSEEIRQWRLSREKKVEAEKYARKTEIVNAGIEALTAHVRELRKRIGGDWLPYPDATIFGQSIKGLKTMDSMKEKISVTLANAKIAANELADRIEINRKSVDDMSLLPDFSQVCIKAPEDFAALLAMRLQQRKEADEKRLEAERGRIRAEEEAKAKREAEIKTEQDQRGKPTEATHALPNATAEPQAPIASTPPIQAPVISRAEILQAIESDLRSFLATCKATPAKLQTGMAFIEEWEVWKAQRGQVA